MKNFVTILRGSQVYFLALFFIFLTGISFAIIFGHDFLFISLSQHHPDLLNIFFINYTFMGDGFFILTMAAFCVFYLKRKQEGFLFLAGFILSAFTVQVIKNSLDASGFKLFFEQGQYLFFTDESVFANLHSFPSGHTANAFMIATVLVLRLKNKKLQIPFLMAAVLMGISRIYLAQDRLIDVLAGAFAGTGSGIISFYFIENIKYLRHFFKMIHRIKPGHPVKDVEVLQA